MNLKSTFSNVSVTLLAFATTGLILHTAPALAEQENQITEIVVIEAQVEVSKVTENTFGRKSNLIELKRRVSYADLDLSKHADVIELQSRLETVSKESCEMLYSISVTDLVPMDEKRRCVKDAIDRAEKQTQAAIIAAS
jgi:UrcA family protein